MDSWHRKDSAVASRAGRTTEREATAPRLEGCVLLSRSTMVSCSANPCITASATMIPIVHAEAFRLPPWWLNSYVATCR